MDQSDKEWLDSTSDLINIGRWPEALEQAREDAQDPELALHARTWFQLGLIEGLHGTSEKRAVARTKAETCTDYKPVLGGDFDRDDAIEFLKFNLLDEARASVESARAVHGHDLNRLICLDMVTGRIQLHAGDYAAAYETLQKAAKAWKDMGSAANRQWQINLQLHLLMAAVMSGHRLRAWLLLPRLLWSDRNRRRWGAALVCLGGKRACAYVLRHR
jgi:tetratricopeptide (TPR) repeat protein